MPKFSSLITCTTECEVQVEADSKKEARQKIKHGEFLHVRLHDGGLDMDERFHDIDITDESFGEDIGADEPKPAPPYDFAVLDNAEKPRSMVYHIDTGQEVATFGTDPEGQAMAERVCETLNAYVKEHGE